MGRKTSILAFAIVALLRVRVSAAIAGHVSFSATAPSKADGTRWGHEHQRPGRITLTVQRHLRDREPPARAPGG